MRRYFYTDEISKFGPFTKEELKSQNISRSTKIWYYGLETWVELSEVADLYDIVSTIPPDLKENSSQIKQEIPPNGKNIINKSSSKETKKSKYKLWYLGLSVVIVLLFVASKIIHKQSELKLYKEIVANAYDDDDTDFDIYIEKFYRDLEHYGIYPKRPRTTIIKFSNLDQLDNTTHIHGLSLGHNDDDRIEIYINPTSWKKFSKPMRYFLMYHELAHDVLNLEDLDMKPTNEGKLMYPAISSYESKNMDEFIESFHALFEEHARK